MRSRRTLMAGLVLAMLVAAGWQPEAGAFFPYGGFNQWDQLRYAKWSWGALNDVNNDRDISGPNEGVELVFEGGPLGWTNPEIEVLEEAFQVWQDVASSYVGFKFEGVSEDPLYMGMPAGSLAGDLVNYVAIQWPDDPIQFPDLVYPTLGVTVFTVVFDDTQVDYGDLINFPVSGGQILEADIIIDGTSHRSVVAGQEPIAELKSTMVHEIGHFIGLGHTPLNNLELVPVGEDAEDLFESPALMLSDATGVPQWVGASPTMFPVYFQVDDGQGGYKGGMADLAPDDIAGASFLYPRSDQSNSFTLTADARSRTRDGFPSVPLGGGHIVAWCDADNNEYTRRIPLFSTMSGLYENYTANVGRFFLYGLSKKLEGGYGQLPFQATYTFTCSPLNNYSFERQAPYGYFSADFDSIEGGSDTYMEPVWLSEVYHETGNLIDIEKYEVGTVLTFDPQRNAVVSTRTGKTLATLLAGDKPMFGDPNQVCPLNVTVTGMTAPVANQKLRALRDGLLLRSSFGTLLVDAYYRVSPALAHYVGSHPWAYAAGKTMMRGANWIVLHAEYVFCFWLALVVGVVWRRRKLATAAMVAGAIMLAGTPAGALIAFVSDSEMLTLSDDVIVGEVTGVESVEKHVPGMTYVMTNVTIQATDTVKAAVNKSSTLSLSSPGGRRGSIITKVSDFPEFTVGEEVVLYVKYNSAASTYTVVGGNRGAYDVFTDSTGEKYVLASSVEGAAALKAASAAVGEKGSAEQAQVQPAGAAKVPLADYMSYLRGLVNEQKKKQ